MFAVECPGCIGLVVLGGYPLAQPLAYYEHCVCDYCGESFIYTLCQIADLSIAANEVKATQAA